LQAWYRKSINDGEGSSLTAVGDLRGNALVAGEADEVEGGVFVVILGHTPLYSGPGAGAAEELGERLHLRPPVVEEPVVEDAKVPHLFPSVFCVALAGRRRRRAWRLRRRRAEGIESCVREEKTYVNHSAQWAYRLYGPDCK
jgi:hypothetical protein